MPRRFSLLAGVVLAVALVPHLGLADVRAVRVPAGARLASDAGGALHYAVPAPLADVVAFFQGQAGGLTDALCLRRSAVATACTGLVETDRAERPLTSGEVQARQWWGERVTVTASLGAGTTDLVIAPWALPLPEGAQVVSDTGGEVRYRVAAPAAGVAAFFKDRFAGLRRATCKGAPPGGLECQWAVVLETMEERQADGSLQVVKWSGEQVTVWVAAAAGATEVRVERAQTSGGRLDMPPDFRAGMAPVVPPYRPADPDMKTLSPLPAGGPPRPATAPPAGPAPR